MMPRYLKSDTIWSFSPDPQTSGSVVSVFRILPNPSESEKCGGHPRLRRPGNSASTALLRGRKTGFYLVSSRIRSSNISVTGPQHSDLQNLTTVLKYSGSHSRSIKVSKSKGKRRSEEKILLHFFYVMQCSGQGQSRILYLRISAGYSKGLLFDQKSKRFNHEFVSFRSTIAEDTHF